MSVLQKNCIIQLSTMEDESDWWNIFVNEEFPDEKCLNYFKCSRKTFLFLIKALKPHIGPKINRLSKNNSIPLSKSKYIQ
jgi:hypothetical protein